MCASAQLCPSSDMLAFLTFANLLVSVVSVRPRSRGEFATDNGGLGAHLLEGDMAVPGQAMVAGTVQEAFLANRTQLWPQGLVSYRFETFQWDGITEPVFLDSQMENITSALEKIARDVPCIKFRLASFKCFNNALCYKSNGSYVIKAEKRRIRK